MGPAHEMGVLDIYDRYADDPDRARLGFPAPYADDVLGSLSYDRTVEAYRRYAAFLNVNSVTDSPTMFSRRVFEILGVRNAGDLDAVTGDRRAARRRGDHRRHGGRLPGSRWRR